MSQTVVILVRKMMINQGHMCKQSTTKKVNNISLACVNPNSDPSCSPSLKSSTEDWTNVSSPLYWSRQGGTFLKNVSDPNAAQWDVSVAWSEVMSDRIFFNIETSLIFKIFQS